MVNSNDVSGERRLLMKDGSSNDGMNHKLKIINVSALIFYHHIKDYRRDLF